MKKSEEKIYLKDLILQIEDSRAENISDLLKLLSNRLLEKNSKRIKLRYDLILHNLIIIDSLIITYENKLKSL